MKLRIYDLKLNDRTFTEAGPFQMYLPAANSDQHMIEWLKEYEHQPYTIDNAIKTYIRTSIFYGSTKLDYSINALIGHDDEQAVNDYQVFNADLFDCKYPLYELKMFDVQLPAEIIVDTDDLMFNDYDDTIDQLVFELLLQYLPITISNIRDCK